MHPPLLLHKQQRKAAPADVKAWCGRLDFWPCLLGSPAAAHLPMADNQKGVGSQMAAGSCPFQAAGSQPWLLLLLLLAACAATARLQAHEEAHNTPAC